MFPVEPTLLNERKTPFSAEVCWLSGFHFGGILLCMPCCIPLMLFLIFLSMGIQFSLSVCNVESSKGLRPVPPQGPCPITSVLEVADRLFSACHSWMTYPRTHQSISFRRPFPSPPPSLNVQRVRRRKRWQRPSPQRRNIQKSAWSKKNYRCVWLSGLLWGHLPSLIGWSEERSA